MFQIKNMANDFSKRLLRILRLSMVFFSMAAFLSYCGKKQEKKNMDKQLTDHKIISLADPIGLGENGENPLENNPEAIKNGAEHFQAMCGVCHGQDARGNLGPDLLDEFWLHGSDNFTIFDILMNGISIENMKMNPPRGKMPGYRDILGPRKVLEVMAWLSSAREKVAEEGQ